MGLLTIGVFARAAGLTPKALRLSDEVGVFRRPRWIPSPGNGLRPAQLERAQLIAGSVASVCRWPTSALSVASSPPRRPRRSGPNLLEGCRHGGARTRRPLPVDHLFPHRAQFTTAKTRTINRLRALLLTGSDADRALCRGALTSDRLAAITRRRSGQHETREHAVRRAEARRLALASAGSTESSPITSATSPTWSPTWRRNCWPNAAWARSAPPRRSCPGPTRAAAATTPHSPGLARSPPAAAASSVTGSTAAATATSTAPCTTSSSTRWRTCQRTRTYITRRRAEGRTDPEIRRCLKRYIAREPYPSLNTAMAP